MHKIVSFRVQNRVPKTLASVHADAEWNWLYQFELHEWESLIQANLEQQKETGSDGDIFFVVRPGTDDVLECPSKIALEIYQKVASGVREPPKAKRSVVGSNKIQMVYGESFL